MADRHLIDAHELLDNPGLLIQRRDSHPAFAQCCTSRTFRWQIHCRDECLSAPAMRGVG